MFIINAIRRAWDRWSIKQQITYEAYQAQAGARRERYFEEHGI